MPTTPIGVYSSVGAGTQAFQIMPTNVPAVSKSIAPSTFYTIALLGEPGASDFNEFIFQDTNSLQSPGTVRFKVNDAAPLPGPIDVYVYQGATLPNLPTVADLTEGNDSGSIANPPGNAYIPPQGTATKLPSGIYSVTVTRAGSRASVLFSGAANLSAGNSYSFTVEDAANSQPSSAQVVLAIDQPMQSVNQANMLSIARRP